MGEGAPMKRTNTFSVAPLFEADAEVLFRVLDASPSLYNELNYARQEAYFNSENIWEIDQDEFRKQYKGVLGSATAQQVIRKNDEAWRGFFDSDQPNKGLPGYWGNRDDGRDLQTYVRNDSYTIEWSDRSRLEIPVGKALKDDYGLGGNERFRLEAGGDPRWDGKQGRLEIHHDELTDGHRAFQPMTAEDCSPESEALASHEAALDVGVNNLVACTTSTGQQFLYEGRDGYEQFRETTMRIAALQSKLPTGTYSSKQIRRLYRKRTRRRDHALCALARDLFERLYEDDVSVVYVGDLTGVLDTHWSVEANTKTHNFWAHRMFIDRLCDTAEEYGITVEERSEANTTHECPACGEREETIRHQETLWCPCGFEAHADLNASKSFLETETNTEVGPMARPVRFEWDGHNWSEQPHSHDSPKESRTNLRVASVGGRTGRPQARGISSL
jgi:putative transposase